MYVLELAGEDDAFAVGEAGVAAVGVERVAPGVALADAVETRGIERLAYTRRATALVGRAEPTVAGAETVARTVPAASSASDGPGVSGESSDDDSSGERSDGESVAVRAETARGIDGPTQATERAVGDVLVERGFSVDLEEPDRLFRVVFTDEECLAGWQAAVSRRGYGARAPTDRPFFQPGSMDPLDARACANLAGAGDGRLLVDPMCGTGGTLIEAGLTGSRVVGVDRQSKMVRGTRQNLRAFLGPDAGSNGPNGTDSHDGSAVGDAADDSRTDSTGGAAMADSTDDPTTGESHENRAATDRPGAPRSDFGVVRGDATRLPLADDTADGVVFDAPYGRQSKIAGHDLRSLVAGALREAARIAPRGVVVADRRWEEAARAAGWSVERVYERPVHRSLTRYVHVLR